jgi:uncharacterized metal-binding protein YceD (DUF177 family)
MYNLEQFKIDLKHFHADHEVREWDLDNGYFEAVGGPEVGGGDVHVSVSIRKTSGFFELRFAIAGNVTIPCDLCLDDMSQPIETENRLVVKMGETYSEDDDTVTIDEEIGILDVAWLIYEFVALAIPVKHVHDTGKCNPAMIKVLEEHSSDRSSDEESTKPIDPRWEKLKGLKIEE